MKRPSYRKLLVENRRLRQDNARLRKEIVALKQRVAELSAALESADRKAKRQAAPFSKGPPKSAAKKPGRKRGRRYGKKARRPPPSPARVDERYDVPLPRACPCCGGTRLRETQVHAQYQTEICRRPICRRFHLHYGVCRDCGRTVHGRHPLQTSDAVGAAASQLGPATHAAMAILNKQLGLSHGKVKRCMEVLFGIKVSRAASAHSVLRSGRRCEAAYEEIRAGIRASPCIVPDETGWRVSGRQAWLHAIVGDGGTCYEIAADRSAAVTQALLEADWEGVMIHDGWSPYDRFKKARHQQCLEHLCRRCQRILHLAQRGAVLFPRQILKLIDQAFATREALERGEIDADETALRGLALACRLEQLTNGRFRYAPNRRLAKHLKKHIWNWFWFLIEPGIEATNWQAEQAIRPAVVNRKVWGGNRTWRGARAQAVLTSVLQTCAQRGHDGFTYLLRLLCSPMPIPLPDGKR